MNNVNIDKKKVEYYMKKKNVDWWVVIPTLLLILFISINLITNPEISKGIIDKIYNITIDKFGWLYMLACISAFGLLLWVTFSGYGEVKLGKIEDKPEHNEFEWASMLFCSGVGAGVVILGFMEPIYYLQSPPFGIQAFSTEAYEYAHMYGQFHWGPSAWAFYIPAIVAVGMMVYKKNEPALKMSVVTKYTIKGKVSKPVGRIIDVFVQFGIIAGISTSLGLGVPVVSLLIAQTFNIPNDMKLKIVIIFLWIAMFTISVFRGLEKGIKKLSNINMALVFIFSIFVLFACGIGDIFSMEINSVGLYFQKFIRMNTWGDPFGDGSFQKMWTIFYWGWWLAFMPLMALFIVKISKGRTLKRVIWMQLIWGSLGCWTCFMIYGGYSLKIHQSGRLNLVDMLNTQGQDVTILELIKTMPMSMLSLVVFCILIFVFLATCIDSAAYVLASGSAENLEIDEQPSRFSRVFWAGILAVLSISLLVINQLKAVQTMSLIAGLPLAIFQIYMCYASIKFLKDYKHKTGVFEEEKNASEEVRESLL